MQIPHPYPAKPVRASRRIEAKRELLPGEPPRAADRNPFLDMLAPLSRRRAGATDAAARAGALPRRSG